MSQSVANSRVSRFPGVVGRNRIHEIGIDDTPFHHVQGEGVEVIAQAIVVEVVGFLIQTRCPQHVSTANPLVFEVMDGVTHSLVPHTVILIHFVEHHRY